MFVGVKPITATMPDPANWTLIAGPVDGGIGSQGADTGPTRLWVFQRDGAFSGAQTIALSGGNSGFAVIITFEQTLGSWATLVTTTGDDTTGGSATYSATCAADPGITAGDDIVASIAIPTDASTLTVQGALASPSITATGISGGTTGSKYGETGTGFDFGTGLIWRTGFTGTASAAPVVAATFTAAVNTYGPTILVRLREQAAAVELDGIGSAASLGSGALNATRPLTGTGSAAASSSGALSRNRPLDGIAPAASAASGVMSRARALDGIGSAAASGTGDLTVATGGVVALDGIGSAAAAASGALLTGRSLAGVGSAASTASGAMTRTRSLDGVGSAASSAVGSLATVRNLVGAGNAAANASGELTVEGSGVTIVELDGTASAAAFMIGSLTVTSRPFDPFEPVDSVGFDPFESDAVPSVDPFEPSAGAHFDPFEPVS
jgi:hypothetical protein